jgi:ABC-2 type transport system ATP-binding protein
VPDVLRARGVAKRHGSGRGVFGIDLVLGSGEVLCLLGPNGSGKTTLLRVLATVDGAREGSLSWFGVQDRRSPAVRRRLGLVLDGAAHFEEMTGYQNAWFFARRFGLDEDLARSRLNVLLSWAGLGEAVHRRVRDYSLGMRQRLALVEALIHDPDLLLLDEPTLGLDWSGVLGLAEQIELRARAGAAAIVATNDVHLAERLGARVAFLHEGRIVRQGTVAELLAEVTGLQEVDLELKAPVPLERLLSAPGVRGGGASERGVHLLLDADANPVRLLAELDGSSRLLRGLRVRTPDLGDAFLRLTGRALDEDAS